MINNELLASELEQRRALGLERRTTIQPEVGGRYQTDRRVWLNFSSNDYLDLARDPRVIAASQAALARYGVGSTSSRVVTGTLPLHDQLEEALARHKGYPAALVFGSGYLANSGMLPALVGRKDIVFADRLIHASLIDGIRRSGATLRRFAHNDDAALEQLLQKPTSGRRLVVTESVFSMDGDLAPLPELAALAAAHDALFMVDEAHATGVFGPCGAGRVQAEGIAAQTPLCMGTLSKALGGYGGYVACSDLFRQHFVQSARSFIYSTAPPPAILGAALGALDVLSEEPERGAQLLARAADFRAVLRDAGFDLLQSESQIIPILVGDNERALLFSETLRAEGIVAVAIRPPTVPPGKARIRLSLTWAHRPEDLAYAADMLVRCARQIGLL